MKFILINNWPIFLLAIINVAIHLYFSKNLEYNCDELLCFSLGMHHAFGYARILAATGVIVSVFGLRTFLLFMSVHIDLMLWTARIKDIN